jgi:hypothetical protein
MKKITLLAVMLLPCISKAQAQCADIMPLPYIENFDTSLPPDLPDCTYSYKQTFVGNDWDAVAAPNSNFTGNVARYVTYSNAGWGMACSFFLRPVQFTAGTNYKISYKYAKNDDGEGLDILRTAIFSNNSQPDDIVLATHEEIIGTTVVNYTTALFTVPATGIYYIRFDVESLGNQGILYLDDIKIEEMDVAGINDNTMPELTCFPNPVKDVLTVTNTGALQQLELYNTTGQLLLTQVPLKETTTLNLEKLPVGVYFLRAKSGTTAKTIQLIKQ